MVKKGIIQAIDKLKLALAEEGIRVEKAILYGSHANGKSRRNSDIDIAIISKDFGKDTVEEGMMLFRIACEIDPRFEPIPISKKSYEKDTWVPLIWEIRENGITV